MAGADMATDDAAESVTHAQQLLDFDWKLKYAVSSAFLAAVNRPLLRLELAVSSDPVIVENVPYFRKESVDEKPQIAIAEYTKTDLDVFISELEAISQYGKTIFTSLFGLPHSADDGNCTLCKPWRAHEMTFKDTQGNRCASMQALIWHKLAEVVPSPCEVLADFQRIRTEKTCELNLSLASGLTYCQYLNYVLIFILCDLCTSKKTLGHQEGP